MTEEVGSGKGQVSQQQASAWRKAIAERAQQRAWRAGGKPQAPSTEETRQFSYKTQNAMEAQWQWPLTGQSVPTDWLHDLAQRPQPITGQTDQPTRASENGIGPATDPLDEAADRSGANSAPTKPSWEPSHHERPYHDDEPRHARTMGQTDGPTQPSESGVGPTTDPLDKFADRSGANSVQTRPSREPSRNEQPYEDNEARQAQTPAKKTPAARSTPSSSPNETDLSGETVTQHGVHQHSSSAQDRPRFAPPRLTPTLPPLQPTQQPHIPGTPVATLAAQHSAQREAAPAHESTDDLARLIKQILDEESRRHGIDV